ncbi:protein Wnt-6-like [Macrobrachium nipponense]|uniref:protein Wnt-6-like n=1 Tax=Macrobrachium nipponense TaxID=159736 RepID=UPI0030C86E23
MAPKFLMYYLLLSLLFCDLVSAFWWSFGSRAVMDYNRICRKRGRKKSKDPLSFLCRKEPTTVNLILTGTQQAMRECQYQFRHHRWNCTDNRRSLRRIFSRETPEAAFLNSIMSASVTYEITSACSRGDLLECSCSKNAYETNALDSNIPKPKNEKKRRKGSKAVSAHPSGNGVSSDLADKKARRKSKKRQGRKGRRKLSKAERRRRLNSIQERNQRLSNALPNSMPNPEEVTPGGERLTIIQPVVDIGGAPVIAGVPEPVGVIGKDWHWSGCDDNVGFGYRVARDLLEEKFLRGQESQDIKSIVMLRNNEAGRLAVRNHLRPHCKCHGLSGSCSHRTCWKRMPSRRNIGLRLKEKYNTAIKVIPSNDAVTAIETNRRPDEEDLVYLDDSPDFCKFNRRTGSLGTKDRKCNATSEGYDGCESLCCGRPYHSQIKMETENCHCRFTFCCEVTCQKCKVRREYSYCT